MILLVLIYFTVVERALNELKDDNIKIKAYVEPVATESTEASA